MVWEKNPTLGAMVGDRVPTAYTNFVEWLQQAHAFDGMAGFEDVSLNRTGTGEPERITSRQKELAIRKALGASRARLIVQMIVEGLLLSFFGCLLAVVVAHFGIQLLLALKPADLQRPEQIHLSVGVLLFTMAIGIVAGVAFAAIPAIYASNTDVNTVLKDSTSNQRHPGRVRAALVIGEVSLAFVLLIGAVFMIGSLVSVLRVDPGFRADHLLTMNFSMPPSRYSKNEQFASFCRQVLERVSALPGVKSASFSDGLPMTRIRMMKFTVDGQSLPKRGSEPTADMRGISSPAYLPTVGIPICAGRILPPTRSITTCQ
jgi:hypothetical protein